MAPATSSLSSGRISVRVALLRGGPSKNAKVLSHLPRGTSVKALRNTNGWVYVQAELEDNREMSGYVFGELISPEPSLLDEIVHAFQVPGEYLKSLLQPGSGQGATPKPAATRSPTVANKAAVVTKPSPTAVNKAVPGAKLTSADFEKAAKALGDGVSVAIIHAFAEVESGGKSGFGANGLPIIAYEGHVFRKLTRRKDKSYPYDDTHPMLSYKYKQKAGPEWQENNKDQTTAWKTLTDAMALDHNAALQSCSWGMFQVMGFNYADCGYASVDDFVTAMKAGESGQLDAFVGYCKKKAGMVEALKTKDFVQMATLYNGEDYGDYDKRISKAYKKYGGA